mmetsp:Transcript_7326/g.12628  ORF Transcript_7326/g.12628 Transcript_7326/m.12628 type:complete len:169 (-) Transcript_7326:245-751(-)
MCWRWRVAVASMLHISPHIGRGFFWQPSDLTPEIFSSIEAYTEGLENVKPPLVLDVSQAEWPVPHELAAVVAINMAHISPWAATQGLLAGAARHLRKGASLFLYGPFTKDGKFNGESNASFDASLRERNPSWGYRDVNAVQAEARAQGLQGIVVDMPANNLMLIFTKG